MLFLNWNFESFWRNDQFTRSGTHESENRILVTILQDYDGVYWAVVNVPFYNDAGQRRQQWDTLVERLPGLCDIVLAVQNIIMRA